MSTLAPTNTRDTAVFDDRASAERAVRALRERGVPDDQLAVVAQHDGRTEADGTGSGAAVADDNHTGERVTKGLAAGAGVGALFGLAALAIPGVGPFITAGFLTHALGATGGAIVSGAVVGGTSGAVAGAFAKAGYTEHEAKYYGDAIERGGILVAVDNSRDTVDSAEIRRILTDCGGRFAR